MPPEVNSGDQVILDLDEFEEDKTPVVPSIVTPPRDRDLLLDKLRQRDAYKKAKAV